MAFAQESIQIKMQVMDENQRPLEGANVLIYRLPDSVFVKGDITNETGEAKELTGFKSGPYFSKVSMLGYSPSVSGSFTLQAGSAVHDLGIIQLKDQAVNLSTVTVTAQKPFIERRLDRLIVNVDGSIVGAGSSAFDVLERSPGILIDANDNISMRGRSGVIIYVDGKPSPMSGADLANFLRGLPANAIDRIDLITNPSARYDAAGNAGIIDIKMKKDQRLGTNGTFSAGYGQGVYPKANTGLSLNHRNKKINVFGNYNYAYRLGLNHLLLDRNFYDNFEFSGKDEKDNYTKIPGHFHALRWGADFSPNEKTILGVVLNANFNAFNPFNRNSSRVFDQNRNPVFNFNTNTDNHNQNNNLIANLNFKRSLDSTGREITADIDYGRFSTLGTSSNTTRYFQLNGEVLRPDYTLLGDQDGLLDFITAKADYTHPINKTTKWEAGFKTSFVSSDQDAKFWEKNGQEVTVDETKTNRFYYKEGNNAGYLNWSKEFKKFSLLVGLRGEHTQINTRQEKGNIRFDSSYFQLFPSAFLNYRLDKNQTFSLSVSRRIDRPGYNSLNPFLFLIDVTTYATGNPVLLPQFTWNFEAGYTRKTVNLTLAYSRTLQNQTVILSRFKDVFPHIPSEENVTVQIPVNLISSDYYGLTMSTPLAVKSWWNMINNYSLFYNHFNGNLSGTSLNNGKAVFSGSTNNNFTMKKGWAAELSFNFNTGNQYGYLTFEPQWALGAGIQKKVLKEQGTLRFNVTDIFWTNLPKATIRFNNYIENWHAYRETRVANLNFTYRFGNTKVAQARRRTTGSEEERQRAGN
ncbi:MAG TPA: outer membrane beta-barrel family protein [Saprospiraceae bacterium]|nr:outer membrane beta-barrel family protein [Saprospiraceae bacterium]